MPLSDPPAQSRAEPALKPSRLKAKPSTSKLKKVKPKRAKPKQTLRKHKTGQPAAQRRKQKPILQLEARSADLRRRRIARGSTVIATFPRRSFRPKS
jgi:hypothetical protein